MTATSKATVYIPDIEGEMYDLDVEFTGETYVENDSIENENKPDYLIIDGEITWDKTKRTEWENAAIAAYLEIKDNREKVEEELINSIDTEDDGND